MGHGRHVSSGSDPIPAPTPPVPPLDPDDITMNVGWDYEDAEISVVLIFPQTMNTSLLPNKSQFTIRYNGNPYTPMTDVGWETDEILIIYYHPCPNPSGFDVFLDYVKTPIPLTAQDGRTYDNFTKSKYVP